MHQTSNSTVVTRRQWLQTLSAGAAGVGFIQVGRGAEPEPVRDSVKTHSEPSKLRITDLRVLPTFGAMRSHILRLDTNQGISGYGEVRDGASATYALMLKSRVVGENPCHIDKIFRKIKQFGGHGRQAGGVVGVEIACCDLAGKAWGIPCWQLLGGRFRDKIRLYADTPTVAEPEAMGRRLKARRERGFTFLKMDIGIGLLRNVPGALTYPFSQTPEPARGPRGALYPNVRHPFTGIRITEKGLAKLAEHTRIIRDTVGWDIPLAADHFGHIGVEDAIKIARALDPLNLAWLEDLIPWEYTDDYVRLKNSCQTPILTGEDIYLKEGFRPLFEKHAISMCHPDLATSGGLFETKKIGDLAMEHGIGMAMHMAGSPVLLYASVHCAAATENFLALEFHDADTKTYEDLVTGVVKPLFDSTGHVQVPDSPGLGIELNEEAVKEMLRRNGRDPEKFYFPPTDEWNNERSNDRQWSLLTAEKTSRLI